MPTGSVLLLPPELTHELSVTISAVHTKGPGQHTAAQGDHCPQSEVTAYHLLLPSVTVHSHLSPAHLQCAPYPGSVSRDPKELLIAACLLNLGYFDRSVAEDARNKQAGATTPSQLPPMPGLEAFAFSPASPPCWDPAALQHSQSPMGSPATDKPQFFS